MSTIACAHAIDGYAGSWWHTASYVPRHTVRMRWSSQAGAYLAGQEQSRSSRWKHIRQVRQGIVCCIMPNVLRQMVSANSCWWHWAAILNSWQLPDAQSALDLDGPISCLYLHKCTAFLHALIQPVDWLQMSRVSCGMHDSLTWPLSAVLPSPGPPVRRRLRPPSLPCAQSACQSKVRRSATSAAGERQNVPVQTQRLLPPHRSLLC